MYEVFVFKKEKGSGKLSDVIAVRLPGTPEWGDSGFLIQRVRDSVCAKDGSNITDVRYVWELSAYWFNSNIIKQEYINFIPSKI